MDMDEIGEVVKECKVGKASCIDEIRAGMLKYRYADVDLIFKNKNVLLFLQESPNSNT